MIGAQVYSGVKVTDAASDFYKQAGALVSVVTKETDKVKLKMDVDGQIHEFDQSQVQAL